MPGPIGVRIAASTSNLDLKRILILRSLLALLGIGALMFMPAGSLKFWQAWVVLAIWFGPAITAGVYFYNHDRQLLERRMSLRETEPEQKLIMMFFYIIVAAAFMLPGFDHRFGWSHVPLRLTVLAQILTLSGYLMGFWVMKVNSFASRTIRVETGQTVISAGPYRVVRHPLYSSGIVVFLFMPLALGSYVALPVSALVIAVIILRLHNEEEVLRRELPGYPDYCLHTRFRLVPFVW